MTRQTRYFILGSLTTLAVGLAAGVIAFYGGIPGLASAGSASLAGDFEYLPPTASVVAYADVRQVMTSDLRQRIRALEPRGDRGKQEFEQRTGIDIDSDLDRVVACLGPDADRSSGPAGALVLARGRFDEVKIEALVREQGGRVEEYRGTRLLHRPERKGALGLAFVEPGLLAVGGVEMVRLAIDSKRSGRNIRSDAELMKLVDEVDDGDLWAVGRFDALTRQGHVPPDVASRLPALTYFSATGRVNGGVSGMVSARARDEQAATNLRDVVRGILALAQLQAGANAEIKSLVDSLQLGGTGSTVSLSFSVPADALDMLARAHGK